MGIVSDKQTVFLKTTLNSNLYNNYNPQHPCRGYLY